MKICMFLNNPHNIDGRSYKESKTLTSYGHFVQIIAVYNPFLSRAEKIGGAEVRRVIKWPKMKIPFLKQMIFSWRWIKEGLKANPDVYHAHDLVTLFEAWICSLIKRKKLVYDPRELFLDLFCLRNRPIARLFWRIRETTFIRKAFCVIIPNKERETVLKKRYPFIKKTIILENFPEIDKKTNIEKSRKEIRRKYNIPNNIIVFIYQGVVNKGRGLYEMIQGIKGARYKEKAIYMIVGNGNFREELEKMVKNYGLQNNFIFTGEVNYLNLAEYICAADIGICFYPHACLNNYYAASNKLYEYMQYKVAILANNCPSIEKIVLRNKAGEVADLQNLRDLSKKIDYLIKNKKLVERMKSNGYQLIKNKYNWQKQEFKLVNLYGHD